MTPLYDAEGNEVVGALDAMEAKELNEKATKAETLEAELQKLQSKDMNFTKYREKTKDEQDKFREQMSAKEKMLMDEVVDLRSKVDAKEEAALNETKSAYLQQFCGTDEELRKQVTEEFDRLPGQPLTPDQVVQKLSEANALVQFRQGRKVEANPLSAFTPSFGGSFQNPNASKKSYADSPEGQNLAKDLGLSTGKQ